jgi:hypothetical protein
MTPSLFLSACDSQIFINCCVSSSRRYAQFLDCTGCDDDVRTLYEAVVGRCLAFCCLNSFFDETQFCSRF